MSATHIVHKENIPVGFWVLGAPGLPQGAQILGEAPPNTATKRPRMWVDVCILGQHLPQMYEKREIYALNAEISKLLGLCPDCLGFGDMAPPSPNASIAVLARGVDEVIHKCPACSGSGRPAIVATVRRARNETRGIIYTVQHAYVPPIPQNFYTSIMELFEAPADMCLACGGAKNATQDGKEIHNGLIDRAGWHGPVPAFE